MSGISSSQIFEPGAQGITEYEYFKLVNLMEKFTLRRKLIHEGLNSLPGVECSLPGGAFYAFPKVIGTGMDGSEFCKRAMHEAGVAIVPGTAFGKTCKDYVRFSFAASRDNISNALENIKKMLG